MDNADLPIDVGRLTKPDEEAFRLIAAALGARFAGDPVPPANDVSGPVRPARIAAAAPDPRAAALLDRMPTPAVVVDGDGVAFMNRAAHTALGYRSAAVLDAAGGLGALFPRGEAGVEPGSLMITAANGATFAARVSMSAVEWGGGRAMLVTLEPRTAPPPRTRGTAGDPLVRLLDANPDPVAIINRSGGVEAFNAAFERVAPGERPIRLEGRLAPGDLRAVLSAVGHAFCLADGVAEPPAPVKIAGAAYRVTVGPLPGGYLACLVFHAAAPAARPATLVDPETETETRGALERAVDDVRRLVDEAAVLVILDGAPVDHGREPAVRFWRSLILAVAARAEVGSVLTLRHEDRTTALRLAPRSAAPFDRALASVRLADLAAVAGLELGIEGDALAVRPARTGSSGVTRVDNLR